MLRLIVTLATAAGTLILPAMSLAGTNAEGKLAMHLIASPDSLGWEALSPAACESIEVDLSLAEIVEAAGYGYLVLLAYDVDAVSGVEFAISGWPTGRGAPALDGPYWIEEDATTFGDHLADGGATGLGNCIEPETTGLTPLAYLTFGPLDSTDVPIHLDFRPSVYTDPEDSLLALTDCTEDFAVDDVLSWSGCTIGGTYGDQMPECGGRSEGGEGEAGEGEDFEWPVTAETGLLYLYGNRLDPPYVFTFENESLFVNHAQVFPRLMREPGRCPEVSESFRKFGQVETYVLDTIDELMRDQVAYDSCLAEAARIFGSSSIVDSLRVVGSELAVWWGGEPYPYWLLAPEEPLPPRLTRREVCIEITKDLQRALRPSRAVIYGTGSTAVMSVGEAAHDVEILMQTQDPNADGLFLLRGELGRDILQPVALDTEH